MTDDEAEADRFLDFFTSPRTVRYLVGAVLFLCALMVANGVIRWMQ